MNLPRGARHLVALVTPLALALAVLVALPPAAQATAQGTSGKVVFVDDSTDSLSVWDPVTEQTTMLVTQVKCPYFGTNQGLCVGYSNGYGGIPSWSPDGTRIAYTRWLPDGVEPFGEPRMHSAVFVMNADGTGQTQVTFPPPAVDGQDVLAAAAGDPNWQDLPSDGFSYSDHSPTWSPNGSTIAFVRAGNIGEDSDRPGAGGQVWTVPVAGGSATQLTHLAVDLASVQAENGNNPPGYRSVVWSPTSPELVAYRSDPNHLDLGLDLIAASTGGATSLVGEWIADYDWSPDGRSVAYLGYPGNGPVHIKQLSGATTDVGDGQSVVRYSPDGNGPVAFSCHTGDSGCGFYEFLPGDPDSNLREGETERLVDYPFGALNSSSDYGRAPWDIQSQDLPVVFLPGFLGSEIQGCQGEALWPPGAWPPTNGSHLQEMRLDGSGCADAHATGKALGSVLGKDIYDGVQTWLDTNAPGGDKVSHVVYGWDWRKSPDAATAGLSTAIDDALAQDLPKRQGTDRVVLLAHSYGGLLGTWYTQQSQANADKVGRVLTIGTPWWGSPKVLMPLAFGIETPLDEPGMDLVLPNDDLQAFSRSLAGLFELFPSPSFGPWLVAGGKVQDSAGVRSIVQALGGDPSLYDAAQAHHITTYDGFDDNGGRTDVQAVVGAGVPTMGSVVLNQQSTLVGWVNGDGTVPLTSAQQGTDLVHPLGDQVHVQAVCGVTHVDLANSPEVLAAYGDFLLSGRTPRRTAGTCPDVGGQMEIFDLQVDLPSQAEQLLTPHVPQSSTDDAGAALSLADAFQQSKIDLLDLPDRTTVVTRAQDPVALRFTANDTRFTYAPITERGTGALLEYGPVSGHVVVAGAASGSPSVTVDGVAVEPHPGTEPTPTPTPTPTPAPTSSPTPVPTADPTSPPPGGTGATGAAGSALLSVTRSQVRRHRLRIDIGVSPAAIGSTLVVRVGGLRLRKPIRTAHVKVTHRLTGALAKAKAVKVRISVTGSPAVRPASTTLVAAARPARLAITKQKVRPGRLVLAGRVARAAKHRVLVTVTGSGGGDDPAQWRGRARIRKGRWHLRARIPAEALAEGEVSVRYPGNARDGIAGAQVAQTVRASARLDLPPGLPVKRS